MVPESPSSVGTPGQEKVMVIIEVLHLVPGPYFLLCLDPAELGPVAVCDLIILDPAHRAQEAGGRLAAVPEQLSLGGLQKKAFKNYLIL